MNTTSPGNMNTDCSQVVDRNLWLPELQVNTYMRWRDPLVVKWRSTGTSEMINKQRGLLTSTLYGNSNSISKWRSTRTAQLINKQTSLLMSTLDNILSTETGILSTETGEVVVMMSST